MVGLRPQGLAQPDLRGQAAQAVLALIAAAVHVHRPRGRPRPRAPAPSRLQRPPARSSWSPGLVTVLVGESFEVVKVDHGHGQGGAGAAGPAHLHRQGVVLCETGQLGRRVGAPTPEAHPATRRPEPRGGPAGPRTAVPARPPARRPAGRSPAGTRAAGRSGTAATARPGRPRPWPGGAPSGRGAAAGWSSHRRARCRPGRGAV
jgi:hypothetical protein